MDSNKTLFSYIAVGIGIMFCMICFAVFYMNNNDDLPVSTTKPDSTYSTNIVNIDDNDTALISEPDSTFQPTDEPVDTIAPIESEITNLPTTPEPTSNNTQKKVETATPNTKAPVSTQSSNAIESSVNPITNPTTNPIYNDTYTKRY